MVRHLHEEGRGVATLVLWLDCDREGENICMEVVDCVRPKAKRSLQILRAHFSAVAKPDILRAMVRCWLVQGFVGFVYPVWSPETHMPCPDANTGEPWQGQRKRGACC